MGGGVSGGVGGGVGVGGDGCVGVGGGGGSVERRDLCRCGAWRISRTYKFMQKNGKEGWVKTDGEGMQKGRDEKSK